MSDHNKPENLHGKIEKNIAVMMVLILLVISIGALVEIVPLAFQKDVTEPVKGLNR
jgi:cytochrome c oxidase cbb3-type subunit 2